MTIANNRHLDATFEDRYRHGGPVIDKICPHAVLAILARYHFFSFFLGLNTRMPIKPATDPTAIATKRPKRSAFSGTP